MKIKIITFFLLLSSFYLRAQSNNIRTNVGVEFGVMLHDKNINNIEPYSNIPNAVISVGYKSLNAVVSLGYFSRFGIHVVGRYMYIGANYTINMSNIFQTQQGFDLELGFTKRFGKKNIYNIKIGASIGALIRNERDYKAIVRPFIISITTRLK
ncbi:hypothetical protein AB832_06955 [Flavobacteriaceae bacterium (ex Bugula neritina AB1)]|nr:hypothetical protein AB832_06955 [Flavobacteriaceae bacterium (ex Bugula neritina AB1)]